MEQWEAVHGKEEASDKGKKKKKKDEDDEYDKPAKSKGRKE